MKTKSGFTLLEVLIATVIFSLAILAIVQGRTMSQRNLVQSERIARAVQLAQAKMVDLEIRAQTELDKNGFEGAKFKDKGKFEEPDQAFVWVAAFAPSPLRFGSDAMLKMMKDLGLDEEEANKQLEQQRLLLTNLNKAVKENFMELHLIVAWDEFGRTIKMPFVTHLLPSKPKIQLTQTAEDETTPATDAGDDFKLDEDLKSMMAR